MSNPSIVKQPDESFVHTMDFSGLLGPGETLSSVTSIAATPSGLTLVGAASVSGSSAQQVIAGGTAGTTYKVTITVLTSAGNTRQGDGLVVVREL